jgi:hypothetical protein
MPRRAQGLTAAQVEKGTTPGRFGDDGGLYLLVRSREAKFWLFRFTRHGKMREMGLGPVIGRDAFGGERRQLVRREGLYDQAKRGSPKLKTFSDTKLGRFLTDQGIDPCWIGHQRGRRFPPLSVLRDRWCARFPHTIWAADSPSHWTHGIDVET